MASYSQRIASQALDEILADFGLSRRPGGSSVTFTGEIPALKETKSQKINLSLIGSIPAGANALAATQIYEARGGQPQDIELDLRRGHNYIDPDIGMTPTINGQEITLDMTAGNPFLQNIFETKDGRFVVLSAVYVDLAYQWTALLGCSVQIDDVRAAVKRWNSYDLEATCAKAGMPMAIVRTESEWRFHPHGRHLTAQPIVPVQRLNTGAPPLRLSPHPRRPLEGVKVLCLTHAIAGPSCGRTLAEHGASVLQIMYTHGYEHAFVYTYANLGTASSRLNLHKAGDRERLWALVRGAHVWVDSYREGGLAKFGFGDAGLFEANPGLVVAHVRCYGTTGPWASKPGFDMQGSSSSGLMYHCGDGTRPRWPPGMVINDYTTGYYAALAVQACLLRRMKEGGGYLVSPSLTGTAMSILKFFKSGRHGELEGGRGKAVAPEQLVVETKMGVMKTLKPLPILSRTPIMYDPIFLDPIGSGLPEYPGFEEGYKVEDVEVMKKEEVGVMIGLSMRNRLNMLRKLGEAELAKGREGAPKL